jgi:hypothetical protein
MSPDFPRTHYLAEAAHSLPFKFLKCRVHNCRISNRYVNILSSSKSGRRGQRHACRSSEWNQMLADRRLLQRIQERKECLLIFGAQFAEAIPHTFGLAAVTFDRVFQC